MTDEYIVLNMYDEQPSDNIFINILDELSTLVVLQTVSDTISIVLHEKGFHDLDELKIYLSEQSILSQSV